MRYYEAAGAEGLRPFKAALRAGTAHFDRGFDFLGKKMFLRGIPRLLVAFNRTSGIFGQPAGGGDGEAGGGAEPLLQCADLSAFAEPSEELRQYQRDAGAVRVAARSSQLTSAFSFLLLLTHDSLPTRLIPPSLFISLLLLLLLFVNRMPGGVGPALGAA